jgi:hypothetical protein
VQVDVVTARAPGLDRHTEQAFEAKTATAFWLASGPGMGGFFYCRGRAGGSRPMK